MSACEAGSQEKFLRPPFPLMSAKNRLESFRIRPNSQTVNPELPPLQDSQRSPV